MNTKIIEWSSRRAQSRLAALCQGNRWYSALAPNIAASAAA
jgi:hypothetical protein